MQDRETQVKTSAVPTPTVLGGQPSGNWAGLRLGVRARKRLLIIACALTSSCRIASVGVPVRPARPIGPVSEPQHARLRVRAAPVVPEPRCESATIRPELWRFGAGAAVAGVPAVTASGRLVFGTAQGLVHSLAPSGEYLWSYTLPGAVGGTVVVDEKTGRCVVGTQSGALEALTSQGTRAWATHIPAGITGPMLSGPRGYLYFTDADHGLYSFARNGVAIWRVPLSGSIVAGPTVWRGEIVVGLEREIWFISADRKLHKQALTQNPELIIPVGDELLLVKGDHGLDAFNSNGPLWSVNGVQGAAEKSGKIVVFSAESSLLWLQPDGTETARVELGLDPLTQASRELNAGQIQLDAAGNTALATQAGEVLKVSPESKVQVLIRLCGRKIRFLTLLDPVLSGTPSWRSVLIVGDDQGVLHAFDWLANL